MDVDVASVIWDELKRYINVVDRVDAAENLISILIDNDCDPEDMKTAFKGDSDFKKALTAYLDQQEEDEEEYDEDEDYGEDDDYE